MEDKTEEGKNRFKIGGNENKRSNYVGKGAYFGGGLGGWLPFPLLFFVILHNFMKKVAKWGELCRFLV